MATKEKLLFKLNEALTEYSKEEIDKILNAYKFADLKHKGQKRASGEDFVTHPLSVAINLAEMNVDADMIIAGLLHDVVEDTQSTMQDIINIFGKNVANLVNGVTKISKLKPSSYNEVQTETIRKMLVAMTSDIKVIIIKFADKIHNLNTLNFLPAEKIKKIANETLEIYAPLAGKLGMHFIKDQLEDLALRWVNPEVYKEIKGYFDRSEKDRDRTKKQITRKLSEKLETIKIPFIIKSRAKHYYSIYNKMKKYTLKIGELFDLYGIRIITDSVQNCYQIFGAVHNLWPPIPGRFKDYIANPKKNGYRSLHTAVKVEKRKVVEIQIRTQEMDEFNEYGVASHWYYKTGEKPNTKELKWLKKLVDLHKQALSPDEYYQTIRDDILKDEIYVFTPKGDSFELPKGATAIDFAYRIHTEVGHRCIGAKAKGMIIPLNRPLQNGVVVDILTSKISNPKRAWLSFVKTANARKKIKSWLASNEKISLKKELEEKQEPLKKEKKTQKVIPKKDLIEKNYSVEVNGEKNFLYNFARCCNPSPTDEIVGFISRGRGVIIHKKDCYSLNYIKDMKKRTIDVNWS